MFTFYWRECTAQISRRVTIRSPEGEEQILTYDARMIEAAEELGLATASPS